jgi:hypothetical protein
MGQRGSRVGAHCQHLAIFGSEIRDTSLVRRELLGSATGERGRKECQDDVLLAAEIGQLDGHTVAGTVGAEGKIWRNIANLQGCFGRMTFWAKAVAVAAAALTVIERSLIFPL